MPLELTWPRPLRRPDRAYMDSSRWSSERTVRVPYKQAGASLYPACAVKAVAFGPLGTVATSGANQRKAAFITHSAVRGLT